LFFLIYINDLPNIMADPSKPILFAGDTSIIIINPSPSKLKEYINNIILYIKLNVCLYLIQNHISEPIETKLCTRLPLGLEETVGYV
jgi:hypothetical protein